MNRLVKILRRPRLAWLLYSHYSTISRGMAFFHGRDAKIVFANPYFCDNLGYTFNEIKGRPFSDFLHPEDAEDARLTARNHDEGITVVSGHVNRWVRKDGSTVNIRWNVGVVGGWFLAEADFLKNE